MPPFPPKTHQQCAVEVRWMVYGMTADVLDRMEAEVPDGCTMPALTFGNVLFQLNTQLTEFWTRSARSTYPLDYPFPHPQQDRVPIRFGGAVTDWHTMCRVELVPIVQWLAPGFATPWRSSTIVGEGCEVPAFADATVTGILVAAFNGWWNNALPSVPGDYNPQHAPAWAPTVPLP